MWRHNYSAPASSTSVVKANILSQTQSKFLKGQIFCFDESPSALSRSAAQWKECSHEQRRFERWSARTLRSVHRQKIYWPEMNHFQISVSWDPITIIPPISTVIDMEAVVFNTFALVYILTIMRYPSHR